MLLLFSTWKFIFYLFPAFFSIIRRKEILIFLINIIFFREFGFYDSVYCDKVAVDSPDFSARATATSIYQRLAGMQTNYESRLTAITIANVVYTIVLWWAVKFDVRFYVYCCLTPYDDLVQFLFLLFF